MVQTTNCVKCGSPNASIVGGHVHKDQEIVIATVCRDCDEHKHQIMNDCKGCYGQWIPAYGYEKNDFGEVLELSSTGFKKL